MRFPWPKNSYKKISSLHIRLQAADFPYLILFIPIF